MTDIYDISLALTAVLLLVALGWSVSLRRKVKEQTERIRNQLAREAALEGKYRDLFENANDMVFSQEVGGKLSTLNKAGERILGCARERALRMSLREFVAPSHVESFEKWLDKCVTGIAPPPLEMDIVSCTAVRSTLEVSARLVREGGKIASIEGIARDVTEKVRAEEALRQSEERFSSAFRVSPVAIGISDLSDWRFIDVNATFLRLFGFQREEVINHTAAELGLWANPDDRIRVEKMFRLEQSVCGAECKFLVKSGNLRTTLLFAERIELGKTPCALTIVHDITERLNLEEQLRKALKMEAVGRLAAGVAHDFNNLLTVIQGNTDLALGKNSQNPDVARALDRISGASQRAANLTQQLLAFSRRQNLQRKPLDLNEVINNGIKMFKHLLREDIMLRFKFSSHLPIVNADPTMVEQVIMNLVVNARDAMPTGGDLIIGTTPSQITPGDLQTHPDAIVGDYVCLSVSDTGCGMDAATQSKIFEPFFTTKEVGKGTGLGLATVYGIVKQHEGWIEVLSEVGKGSTFKIYFPSEKRVVDSKPSPLALANDGRKTILAVEDESYVAELIRKVLEDEGYRVLEASDGLVALQVWNDCRGQVDLLLTDVKMPHSMSGVDLAENLRALKPELKVLFTSGYSPESINSSVFSEPNTIYLPKPYSPAKLIQTVHGSLGAPVQPASMAASAKK